VACVVEISEVCAGKEKTSEIPSHIPSEISEGSEKEISEGSGNGYFFWK